MTLLAGASAIDISPRDSQFLYGYPHVERFSTGIHDPLLSSALFLSDGKCGVLFIANDILWFGKATTGRVRERIAEATGVPPAHILLSATHTHSGPNTVDWLAAQTDPVVPPVDAAYLRLFEDGLVQAGVDAVGAARPARAGLVVADGTGVGTNRHDPSGPHDPEAPVLLAREATGDGPIAAMMIYSMHPTVLHEDSRLVSGDFPAMARQYVQDRLLGRGCPFLYHTGPAGNQSPRHVTRGNTFEEAERLGAILGEAVVRALEGVTLFDDLPVGVARSLVDLPHREFPPVSEAEAELRQAREAFERLRREGASSREVRTAECAVFGAEEKVTLSAAQANGTLDSARQACLPAEVQAVRVGPWVFVGWQGEIFTDYALDVKRACPRTYPISYANGDLQGYIVTPEAAAQRTYEAGNALFAPESGRILADAAVRLARVLRAGNG